MKTRVRARIVQATAAVIGAASETARTACRCLAAIGALSLGVAAGAAEPEPAAGRDRAVELRLDSLSVHLDIRDGKVTNAFAVSSLRALGAHRVEHQLTLAGTKLDGEVKIVSGTPFSAGALPAPVTYVVRAVLGRRTVSGDYERAGENGKVSGRLLGRVGPRWRPQDFSSGLIWIEAGGGRIYFPAAYAQSRQHVLVRMDLADGVGKQPQQMLAALAAQHDRRFLPTSDKCIATVPCPYGDLHILTGKQELAVLDGCDLRVQDGAVSGTMTFRSRGGQAGAAKTNAGAHRLSFTGQRVGIMAAGSVSIAGEDGKESGQGGFVMMLTPSVAKQRPAAPVALTAIKDSGVAPAKEGIKRDLRPIIPKGGLSETWADRLRDTATYLYPPVFGIPANPRAKEYQVEVTTAAGARGDAGARVAQWRITEQTVSLAPVWEKLETGTKYRVTATALNGDGKPGGGPTTARVFTPSAPFVPNQFGPVRDPIDRIRKHLEALCAHTMHVPFQDPLLTSALFKYHGKCQETFPYVAYGVVAAHLTLARLVEDPDEAREATTKALLAGEWLAHNAGPHSLWTYHWADCNLTPFGGLAFLELYDATGEKRWAEAARKLASTYRKTQLDNGTWQWMLPADPVGTRSPDNHRAPYTEFDASTYLFFLGRYRASVRSDEFLETERKALAWMMENSAKTFYWRHQAFKMEHNCDILTGSLTPTRFCQYLLECPLPGTAVDAGLIAEVIRYCEDRFVDWGSASPGLTPRPNVFEGERTTSELSRIALVMAQADQAAGRQDYRSRIDSMVASIYAIQTPATGLIPYAPGAPIDYGNYYMNYRMAETGVNLLRIAALLSLSPTNR